MLVLKALVKQGQIIATTLIRIVWDRLYASHFIRRDTSILTHHKDIKRGQRRVQ